MIRFVARWLAITAVIVVAMIGFYQLNVFQASRGYAAKLLFGTDISGQKARYLALSQAAEYIVYGRVIAELDQTKGAIFPDPQNPSFVIPTSSSNFLIEVIQSVTARGGKDDQAPLNGKITIRGGRTSHSATFVVGETFVAFLKSDPATQIYYVVGLTAGSLEGKLPVIIRNGQAYVNSGETATQLLEIARKPQ